MICKYCENEIADGMKFCPNCGKKIEPEVEKFTGEVVDDASERTDAQPNFNSDVKRGFGPQDISDTISGRNRSKNTYATMSLILGVISLICCCAANLSMALGIVAVILGVIAIKNNEENMGLAIAGIICGALGVVIGFSAVVLGGLLSFLNDFTINGVKYFRW